MVAEDRAMVDRIYEPSYLYHPILPALRIEKILLYGVRHLEWTGKGLTNAAGELTEFVGVARDVTDKLDLIEKLAQQANHDDLTGLCNRRFLIQQAQLELTRAKRYASPLSLFMLDIDHFKVVNDQYGHLAGDAVLKAVERFNEALATGA